LILFIHVLDMDSIRYMPCSYCVPDWPGLQGKKPSLSFLAGPKALYQNVLYGYWILLMVDGVIYYEILIRDCYLSQRFQPSHLRYNQKMSLLTVAGDFWIVLSDQSADLHSSKSRRTMDTKSNMHSNIPQLYVLTELYIICCNGAISTVWYMSTHMAQLHADSYY
jgi:hypothetical protein